MIIIIDGYNLLKQLHPNNKENLEFHKKVLLRKLSVYKKVKQADIKEIIVVYDGGCFNHATREIHHGIVTLEAGYKRSADDWIIEYVDRYKNQEITIVSMDRALCLTCEQHGAFSIGVFDFAQALNQVIKNAQAGTEGEPILTTDTQKLQDENYDINIEFPQEPTNLDDLMQEGAHMHIPQKKERSDLSQTKKSPPLSKQEKLMVKKMKKIY